MKDRLVIQILQRVTVIFNEQFGKFQVWEFFDQSIVDLVIVVKDKAGDIGVVGDEITNNIDYYFREVDSYIKMKVLERTKVSKDFIDWNSLRTSYTCSCFCLQQVQGTIDKEVTLL